MKKWIKRREIEIIIFFLALLPRFIFMFGAYLFLGDYSFRKDQDGYMRAGLNLLRHGVYTGSQIFPLTPHSFPAPGYSIITAVSWLIIPRFLFIAFWQNILFSLVVVFVYKFSKLFFNNFVSVGAALLMAFEPFSIFFSNAIMSETLFLFLFILSVYLLALFWKEQRWKYLIWSAILLGLAALVRQIAVFFYPVVVFSLIVMLWKKVKWQKILKYALINLTIFLAVTAPWCIRNKLRFGSYTISNQTHFLYFFDTIRDFVALSKGISKTEAMDYLKDLAVKKAGVESFEEIGYIDKYIPVLKEIEFDLIREKPFTYFKWHMIKALPVLTDSGWLNILRFWKSEMGQSQAINISSSLAQGNIRVIISELKSNKIFLLRIIGIVVWLIIDIIAVLGLILMIRRKELIRISLIMLAIISYFVFASSWAAMARLRLPFQPFLFIFFIYPFYLLKKHEQEE